MATIKPFRALRPAGRYADRIAALPYDVYNRAEAKAEVEKEPLSFLKIDRAETQFDDSVDTYADMVYEKAKSTYEEMKKEGYYLVDASECFYLYELTMKGRAQTGIVGCASIDDYENGVIKKHENTRADKEVDRINHVDTMSAQTGPIFLAYHQDTVLSELVNKIKERNPVNDFTSPDDVTHRVWIINNDEEIKLIRERFEKIGNVYIADGHHRCASAVKVGLKRRAQHPGYTGDEEFNTFLSVLFPDNELMIMDYNRVVRDLNGHSVEEVIAYLREHGRLRLNKSAFHPQTKGECGIYLDHSWYAFTFDETLRPDDPVEGLDVSILQRHILEPLFGIADPKTDQRIEFVGGIRGLDELERRVDTDCQIAFAMYPTQISELFAVADAGKLMPPKSTWFEPKLRSGLFIHEI
ncbi:MAG: DUF1015 domain-containing protein [Lachnospiraceae bacterium]|nr:DUF1015 domain-containing protein [Lachnospiraceae bacterium]